MKRKKIILLSAGVVLLVAVLFIGNYCCKTLPIISGYSAKMMCSEVFIGGRSPEQVKAEDLLSFPLSLGSCEVDYKDSSVTASVYGLFRQKAVYRRGLGSTLLTTISEDSLRRQDFAAPAPPIGNTADIPWPFGDKLQERITAGIDRKKLRDAVQDFFAEPDTIRRKLTRALVVVYNGQIISEQYAPGFSADSKLLGWSMAKSVTGALTGILVKKGLVDPNSAVPVGDWVKNDDPRHAITWKMLLQQVSGLKFDEDYSKSSDATVMLYKTMDMGSFAASHPLDTTPGTRFRYSSGNSNILSLAIRKAIGDKDYHVFPYKELFFKLGMYHAEWEPDESGTFVGSSYLYASARDWARFGLFFLNRGNFNNEQLLPEKWVEQSVDPLVVNNFDHYGFQFWLNTGKKKGDDQRFFPHVPDDMYYADGFQGQNLFIIPSKKLIVVRLGMTASNDYHADESLGLLLAAIH